MAVYGTFVSLDKTDVSPAVMLMLFCRLAETLVSNGETTISRVKGLFLSRKHIIPLNLFGDLEWYFDFWSILTFSIAINCVAWSRGDYFEVDK